MKLTKRHYHVLREVARFRGAYVPQWSPATIRDLEAGGLVKPTGCLCVGVSITEAGLELLKEET